MNKTVIVILISVLFLTGCESSKKIVKDGKTYTFSEGYFHNNGKKYQINYKIVNGKYESELVEVE